MNTFWNSSKKQLNEGKVSCKECHNRGYHTQKGVYLKTMCSYCGGRGEIDWIDHMTGNPSPRRPHEDFKHQLMLDNVEILMYNIKTLMMENGFDVRVKIDEIPNNSHKYRLFPFKKYLEKDININERFKTLFHM